MRLIDADALLEKMKKTSRYFNVVFDIESTPTVDAVEVVRCKDCKWYKCDGCFFSTSEVEENDFCSYGEKK